MNDTQTEPETVRPGEKPLSLKHDQVITEYLKCFIEVDAYKRVYPTTKHNAAKSSAARLFADANFQAHLNARRKEIHMGEDEALKLHADVARGDMGNFISIQEDGDFLIDLSPRQNPDGTVTPVDTRLLKKLKSRKTTRISKDEDGTDEVIIENEIQLYSAHAARQDILKIHGKFKDKGDSAADVKVPITVVEIVRPDGK